MPWDKGCYERGRWLVEPIEDWSQFSARCHWYTFRFFTLECELLGGVEITFVVLGIGLRWRWKRKMET